MSWHILKYNEYRILWEVCKCDHCGKFISCEKAVECEDGYTPEEWLTPGYKPYRCNKCEDR